MPLVLPILLSVFWLVGCTNQNSITNRYLTAEKLWMEKNYSAAVDEFDSIIKEEPDSTIALNALLRSSMTKSLFLSQPEEALRGFKLYLEKASSSDQVPSVEKEIGDIYFYRLKLYPKAILHYEQLLAQKNHTETDRLLFQYRIARANFLLGKIKPAIDLYAAIEKAAPSPEMKARVMIDLGQCWYAIGEAEKIGFQTASQYFQKAKIILNNSTLPEYQEAEFGLASVMEEQDQLEQAYELFKKLESTYPAKNVIRVRVLRLEDRLRKKRK